MVVVDPVEVSNEVEWRVLAVVFGLPVKADRMYAGEQVVTEGGDERCFWTQAIAHYQGECVFRVVLIGCSVHRAGFATDRLTGRGE
jgi:hypothetical protein